MTNAVGHRLLRSLDFPTGRDETEAAESGGGGGGVVAVEGGRG